MEIVSESLSSSTLCDPSVSPVNPTSRIQIKIYHFLFNFSNKTIIQPLFPGWMASKASSLWLLALPTHSGAGNQSGSFKTEKLGQATPPPSFSMASHNTYNTNSLPCLLHYLSSCFSWKTLPLFSIFWMLWLSFAKLLSLVLCVLLSLCILPLILCEAVSFSCFKFQFQYHLHRDIPRPPSHRMFFILRLYLFLL